MNRRPSQSNASTRHEELSHVHSSQISSRVQEPDVTFSHSMVPSSSPGVLGNTGLGKDEKKDGENDLKQPTIPLGANVDESSDNDVPHCQARESHEDHEVEKTAFPILLHEIVSDPDTDDCIHWLQDGHRFMITNKQKFASEVLPKYYGHAKFTSFTRRLKRWSFSRVPSGPFMGAYYNPNFIRGEPKLAARVRYSHPATTPHSALVPQMSKTKPQGAFSGFGSAELLGLTTGQTQASLSVAGMTQLEHQVMEAFLTPASNNSLALRLAMAQEMQRRQNILTKLSSISEARTQAAANNEHLDERLIRANPGLAAQLLCSKRAEASNTALPNLPFSDKNSTFSMLLLQQQNSGNNSIMSLLSGPNITAAQNRASNMESNADGQRFLTASFSNLSNQQQQQRQELAELQQLRLPSLTESTPAPSRIASLSLPNMASASMSAKHLLAANSSFSNLLAGARAPSSQQFSLNMHLPFPHSALFSPQDDSINAIFEEYLRRGIRNDSKEGSGPSA